MKLRIKGNSIRLRLTKTEVEEFGEKHTVSERVSFAHGQYFAYQIVQSEGTEAVSAVFKNNTITVQIPAVIAEAWTNTDQVGFEQDLKTGEGSLHILVEKDFQCLHRDDAEEPDNYTHPLADSES